MIHCAIADWMDGLRNLALMRCWGGRERERGLSTTGDESRDTCKPLYHGIHIIKTDEILHQRLNILQII